MIPAYHFTAGATLRDGRPVPPVGEWLEHKGPLKLCESGLHASERLLDALGYAPGLTLHVVTCDDATRGDDKLVCRRRRIELTRGVSRRAVVRLAIESACLAAWCGGLYLPDLITALDAVDCGDFAAARDAAWAASDAARDARAAWAASAAAWAAKAAWAAARDARAAARAARDAAWAASAAARDAAWAASAAARAARAARAAARDAAWAASAAASAARAARAAARDAARAASAAASAAASDAARDCLEARARTLLGVAP